jgi:hypothetical protein
MTAQRPVKTTRETCSYVSSEALALLKSLITWIFREGDHEERQLAHALDPHRSGGRKRTIYLTLK